MQTILHVCFVLLDKISCSLLVRRTARSTKPFDISLKLNFSAGCKCTRANLKIPVDFEVRIHFSSANSSFLSDFLPFGLQQLLFLLLDSDAINGQQQVNSLLMMQSTESI